VTDSSASSSSTSTTITGLLRLTPRQLEAFRRLANGQTAKVIAFELGESLPAIRYDIRTVIAKLGATNLTQAIAMLVGVGVVALEPASLPVPLLREYARKKLSSDLCSQNRARVTFRNTGPAERP
jgi:DNA-binding CsgD family transcriptional regulator